MQPLQARATAHRRTFKLEPGRHVSAEFEPLTPAERIALTIALLNRGLDFIDGFARTSLAGCTQGAVRRRRRPEPARHPLHQG
jgi:hypothetical protein